MKRYGFAMSCSRLSVRLKAQAGKSTNATASSSGEWKNANVKQKTDDDDCLSLDLYELGMRKMQLLV